LCEVKKARKEAWEESTKEQKQKKIELIAKLEQAAKNSSNKRFLTKLKNDLIAIEEPIKKDLAITARKALRFLLGSESVEHQELRVWIDSFLEESQPKFSNNLYSELPTRATNVKAIPPEYTSSELVDGRIILKENFDALFAAFPEAIIFGEDTGAIGDVNQGLEGLQSKYGEHRIADTGIRETTIIGQGIGMALRGLRPIAEIQYLDYIFYALPTLMDDLACLRYRTSGKQKAPLIIRTRGHRLEGIWHSGSQMGGLIHLLRGIYILSPRNMTQAAGFYNTLMKSDEPALIIESLNGYRLKEKLPSNLSEICTPIGVVETMTNLTPL